MPPALSKSPPSSRLSLRLPLRLPLLGETCQLLTRQREGAHLETRRGESKMAISSIAEIRSHIAINLGSWCPYVMEKPQNINICEMCPISVTHRRSDRQKDIFWKWCWNWIFSCIKDVEEEDAADEKREQTGSPHRPHPLLQGTS